MGLFGLLFFLYSVVAIVCIVYPFWDLLDGRTLADFFSNDLLDDLSAGITALRISSIFAGITILASLGNFKENFIKGVNIHQYAFYANV
ncbi:MAG: hypothetical protein RIF34_03720, partial [Candidatus Kapaibacterium sp.]